MFVERHAAAVGGIVLLPVAAVICSDDTKKIFSLMRFDAIGCAELGRRDPKMFGAVRRKRRQIERS